MVLEKMDVLLHKGRKSRRGTIDCTYKYIVAEKHGVEDESDGNWDQRHQFIGMNLNPFPPVQVLDLDPVRDIRDETQRLGWFLAFRCVLLLGFWAIEMDKLFSYNQSVMECLI